MFSLFKKDPVKKLNKKYQRMMEKARDIQRTGDLKKYAAVIEEAEEVAKEIETLKAGQKN